MVSIHNLSMSERRFSQQATRELATSVNVYRDGDWLCETKRRHTPPLETGYGETASEAVADFRRKNAAVVEQRIVEQRIADQQADEDERRYIRE